MEGTRRRTELTRWPITRSPVKPAFARLIKRRPQGRLFPLANNSFSNDSNGERETSASPALVAARPYRFGISTTTASSPFLYAQPTLRTEQRRPERANLASGDRHWSPVAVVALWPFRTGPRVRRDVKPAHRTDVRAVQALSCRGAAIVLRPRIRQCVFMTVIAQAVGANKIRCMLDVAIA